MIRNKKLVDLIRPLLNEMSLPDEAYGHIIRKYSPACKCSATVKMLDYFELCKLSKNNCYNITIIQNGKIFDMELHHFYVRYECISACYQINPFNNAIVIAENMCKSNSYKVFCYEPYAFDKSITLPNISCYTRNYPIRITLRWYDGYF